MKKYKEYQEYKEHWISILPPLKVNIKKRETKMKKWKKKWKILKYIENNKSIYIEYKNKINKIKEKAKNEKEGKR